MWSETQGSCRESLKRWRFASTVETLEVAANFHPKSEFTMKIGRSLGKIDSESLAQRLSGGAEVAFNRTITKSN